MIARELIGLPPYAEEVETGLSRQQKTLPCKLFYDQTGSALFDKITELPEYYLTRTELEILELHSDQIAAALEPGISVIELGSGTATKTGTLLRALLRRQLRVPFFPVDISPAALAEARSRIEAECPRAVVRPVVADFSNGFGFLRDIPGRKLVLYLGSSIGNFNPSEAVVMLSQIQAELQPKDALLLGTDLAKDPSILVPAYNDAQGVTAQFNKNILARLNRELGANFDLNFFRHIALWNPVCSRMEIYVESLRPQTVHFKSLGMTVKFANGERIHSENSYKYNLTMVSDMLNSAGFTLDRTWFDDRKWFALHLAQVL